MNSRDRNLLIAGAVASALAATAAHALPPSVTPDFTLYAAGGSAQANAFYTAANKILTSVDSYTTDATGKDNGSYRIVFGDTAFPFTFNGTSIPAGKHVLYFYKFNGGSFPNGVAPQVGSGSTLAYPFATQVLGSAVSIAGAPVFPGGPTFSYTIGSVANAQVPDWGVADTEVGLFQGFNNPGLTGTNVTTPNFGGGPAPAVGASTGIYDNLFGVAITDNLYGTVAGKKSNFNKQEIAGIYSGALSDWKQILDDTGAPLPAGPIFALDRGQGSGTKASANQYFFGYPGSPTIVTRPRSQVLGYTSLNPLVTTSTTYQLVNESSTTNIINDLFAANAAGVRAVAVLGLENPPVLHQTAGHNTYDFTKINGVSVDAGTATDNINGTSGTTYINVVTGRYDFFFQNSFNTRSGFLAGTSTGALFANEFQSQMSSTGFTGAGAGLKFPLAVGGTLADADNSSTLGKGETTGTRSKVSTTALVSKFGGAVPASSEPF